MTTLYIATTNPGKLRDFALAAGPGIAIEPLPNLASIPAPPEDELTFEGNARIKAVAYSLAAPGLLVLADDSGLEVDALHGAPGVRSARYAEDAGYSADDATPDQRNNACLLHQLAGATDRHARYRCSLALARGGRVLQTADGELTGTLLTAPQGTSGFGYDPLFYLPQHARTMAELDPATRLALSHRGAALRRLLTLIDPESPNFAQLYR